jgi:hypothetical protein
MSYIWALTGFFFPDRLGSAIQEAKKSSAPSLSFSAVQGQSKRNFGYISNCSVATCFDPAPGLSSGLHTSDADPDVEWTHVAP